jgi:hypothetical protein
MDAPLRAIFKKIEDQEKYGSSINGVRKDSPRLPSRVGLTEILDRIKQLTATAM